MDGPEGDRKRVVSREIPFAQYPPVSPAERIS
jgi:hypothetical protein